MKRFVVCILLVMSSFQSNANINLSVSPSSQSLLLGTQASFDININGLGSGVALGTYDFTFNFDPTLLSYSATTFGNQLDLFGLGDIQLITTGSGNLELFELSLESLSDLNSLQSSNFLLATLTFDTLSTGTNSPITLSVLALGDASGNPITASIQNASVSVSSAVPIPGAVWLFSSAIGLLGLMRRRTKLSFIS